MKKILLAILAAILLISSKTQAEYINWLSPNIENGIIITPINRRFSSYVSILFRETIDQYNIDIVDDYDDTITLSNLSRDGMTKVILAFASENRVFLTFTRGHKLHARVYQRALPPGLKRYWVFSLRTQRLDDGNAYTKLLVGNRDIVCNGDPQYMAFSKEDDHTILYVREGDDVIHHYQLATTRDEYYWKKLD